MSTYLPIHGTWGWQPDPDPALPRNWWRQGSPFTDYLDALGFELLHPEDPFVWTGDVNGWRFWRRWFGRPENPRDWRAGGRGLRWYLTAKGIPYGDRNLIAHSHGLQVVLYAAAEWHEPRCIPRLLTIGAPFRADMQAIAARARRRIGAWLHVTDADDDTQRRGRYGDGAVGTPDWFTDPALGPDTVLVLPGIGHSKLLQDRASFDLWMTRGLVEFLTGGAGV